MLHSCAIDRKIMTLAGSVLPFHWPQIPTCIDDQQWQTDRQHRRWLFQTQLQLSAGSSGIMCYLLCLLGWQLNRPANKSISCTCSHANYVPTSRAHFLTDDWLNKFRRRENRPPERQQSIHLKKKRNCAELAEFALSRSSFGPIKLSKECGTSHSR